MRKWQIVRQINRRRHSTGFGGSTTAKPRSRVAFTRNAVRRAVEYSLRSSRSRRPRLNSTNIWMEYLLRNNGSVIPARSSGMYRVGQSARLSAKTPIQEFTMLQTKPRRRLSRIIIYRENWRYIDRRCKIRMKIVEGWEKINSPLSLDLYRCCSDHNSIESSNCSFTIPIDTCRSCRFRVLLSN